MKDNLKGTWILRNGQKAEVKEWNGNHWTGRLKSPPAVNETPLLWNPNGNFFRQEKELRQWDLMKKEAEETIYPPKEKK